MQNPKKKKKIQSAAQPPTVQDKREKSKRGFVPIGSFGFPFLSKCSKGKAFPHHLTPWSIPRLALCFIIAVFFAEFQFEYAKFLFFLVGLIKWFAVFLCLIVCFYGYLSSFFGTFKNSATMVSLLVWSVDFLFVQLLEYFLNVVFCWFLYSSISSSSVFLSVLWKLMNAFLLTTICLL